MSLQRSEHWTGAPFQPRSILTSTSWLATWRHRKPVLWHCAASPRSVYAGMLFACTTTADRWPRRGYLVNRMGGT